MHIWSELGERAVTGVVRTTFMSPEQHKALIGDLMVAPSVQNIGTGTSLLEAMENVLYTRGCLPELLTNALAHPYEVGDPQLLRFYGNRGFGDAYSAVGLIGTESDRLLENQRPESLHNSAWVYADKIYDSLMKWNYPDFQQQIVPGLFPPALFAALKGAGNDSRSIDRSWGMEYLYLGYPHRRFTDSNNNEWVEVCSALKSEAEGFKILRLLTLPSNFFEDDSYSPGIDGLYVFKALSMDQSWLKLVRVESGKTSHLRQITDKEWDDMLRYDIDQPRGNISDTALEMMDYCAALISIIQGRNTIDDLRRYDRRWRGETGYPWTEHTAGINKNTADH